jgi:hypothetical protein
VVGGGDRVVVNLFLRLTTCIVYTRGYWGRGGQ